jgi:hypothetical protein
MRTAFSVVHNFALAMIGCVPMIAGDANAQATVQRFVTQGRANTVVDDLYKCPVKVGNHRVSAVGQIMATDGTVITVPAETAFQKGAALKGADLFNECNQLTPQKSADVMRKETGAVGARRALPLHSADF